MCHGSLESKKCRGCVKGFGEGGTVLSGLEA